MLGKKRSKRFFSKSLLITAFAALLTQGFVSCSSDSKESTTTPTTGTLTGIFLDCEVEGLTYQSGNGTPGVTDENGTFTYTPGQSLSFSVGGVQLGTLADGASICTPFDFVIPENIARFLQSIDGDGDPSNGINLTAASAALAGQTVTSDVFENPSSTGFAADPAITGALLATGDLLLDTATSNTNLRDGTDTTFEVAELAGFAFIFSSPIDAGLGVVKFDELANPTDQGSTGSATSFDESVAQGGTGAGEDFVWTINSAGVLSLTFPDGTVTIRKSGSSTRAITGVESEPGSPPNVITLLKPLPITETSICGAPITVGGTVTKSYTITSPNGTEQITFKSDGTMIGIEPGGLPDSSFWSVGDLAPNVLKITTGLNGALVPDEWSLVVFLEGSPEIGGQLFISDVTFNGFDVSTNDPILTWDAFLFLTITPN